MCKRLHMRDWLSSMSKRSLARTEQGSWLYYHDPGAPRWLSKQWLYYCYSGGSYDRASPCHEHCKQRRDPQKSPSFLYPRRHMGNEAQMVYKYCWSWLMCPDRHRKDWDQAPESGEHKLTVHGKKENIQYTLNVAINLQNVTTWKCVFSGRCIARCQGGLHQHTAHLSFRWCGSWISAPCLCVYSGQEVEHVPWSVP